MRMFGISEKKNNTTAVTSFGVFALNFRSELKCANLDFKIIVFYLFWL